ncbi:MAG: hypothetical protein JW809_15665 [Pirellulales bacterium]|nr:hypothetical protein [Pirellulales bacterium]
MSDVLRSCCEASRVLIVVNPAAGASSPESRVDQLAGLLTARGLRVEVLTDLDGAAQRAIASHRERSLRALVGVGGDGTAAELVNRTDAGVPITMLPAGTSNLLSGYLGMEKSPEGVCRTITHGRCIQLDAGRAAGRLFTLMMSCGFDADVVQRLHRGRSGHIGRYSYVPPILSSIRHYRYPELRIHWDDSEDAAAARSTLSARWFFAFNLPCYAGWPPVAPEALGDDGLLDACTYARGSFWHGVRLLTAVLRQRQNRLAGFAVRRIRRVRVEASEEVPYQIDGDPGGVLPVEVEVVPRRLTFLVPGETTTSATGLARA